MRRNQTTIVADQLPGWQPGHTRDMEKALRKVNHRRVGEWLRELDMRGQVVFRASAAKVGLLAVGSWIFLVAVGGGLIAMDWSEWVLFSDPSRWASGVVQLVFGILLLGGGLLVFGSAAVLFTFVVPFQSPRTIVTHHEVRYVWGADPLRRPLFATQWCDVVAVRGILRRRIMHLPAMLALVFYVRRSQVSLRRGRPSETRTAAPGQLLTGEVGFLLRDHRPDILAFLLEVHRRSQSGGRRQ